MTKRVGREGHCHRCIYSWRIRGRGKPAVCPRCKSRLWNVPKIRPLKLGNGVGIKEVIGPHRREILRIAREHGIRTVCVFGSVRRREATASSDLDLLLEWRRPHSILDRASFAATVEMVIGRGVDAVTRGALHWALEPQVEAEAVPL